MRRGRPRDRAAPSLVRRRRALTSGVVRFSKGRPEVSEYYEDMELEYEGWDDDDDDDDDEGEEEEEWQDEGDEGDEAWQQSVIAEHWGGKGAQAAAPGPTSDGAGAPWSGSGAAEHWEQQRELAQHDVLTDVDGRAPPPMPKTWSTVEIKQEIGVCVCVCLSLSLSLSLSLCVCGGGGGGAGPDFPKLCGCPGEF